ncbi:MFS transporter [Pseudomonas aeruginosa]|nr:MFS transporter [Pseudomonas aeruginosa]
MVSKTLPSTATPPLGAPAKYTDFKTNTYIIGFSASLYMVLLITPMITTKLVEQYSLSASAVGTLLFIEIGAFSFATIPSYFWLRRVNLTRATWIFGTTAVMGNVLSGLVGSYELLIIFRVVAAVAAGSITVIILTMARKTKNPSRSYALFLASQLGMAAIFLAAYPVLFENRSVSAIYYALALLALVCLPLAGLIDPNTYKREAAAEKAEQSPASDRTSKRLDLTGAMGLATILLFYISLSGVWAFMAASRPEIMGRVLGIVYRVIATHLVKKAGHTHQVAKTGAVTLIQRFGSALNLNVHFHMLFLDGVYVEQSHGSARFRWVKAPTSPELTQLTHTIAHRVGRYLERQGLLERDVENSYLASDAVDDDPMTPLLGHSITYRIAVGSQAGRKVFTLQTLPTSGDPFGDGIGKVAGFSLHAGVAARADERKKLERLCRYISRPAVSEKRLSLTRGGNVRYQLKTPYRDGTTHVIFEPLDFIARLAALVPKPRVNLTRFHGVFAPNSRHRALVTPAKRGRGNKVRVADEPATPAQRRASMTWAQRLKRVFNIDIETCSGCGGAMKVIACIEDPIVIKQILDHLKHKAETSGTRALPERRAPPAERLRGLFD